MTRIWLGLAAAAVASLTLLALGRRLNRQPI